jgi:hypothetical protein
MHAKGLIFISLLILIPGLSCKKQGDLIVMHFSETYCANPWSVNNDDPDYQNKVKSYLEQKNIRIKKITISNDFPASNCFACICTSGRTINITIYERDKTIALDLGFFSN